MKFKTGVLSKKDRVNYVGPILSRRAMIFVKSKFN